MHTNEDNSMRIVQKILLAEENRTKYCFYAELSINERVKGSYKEKKNENLASN